MHYIKRKIIKEKKVLSPDIFTLSTTGLPNISVMYWRFTANFEDRKVVCTAFQKCLF